MKISEGKKMTIETGWKWIAYATRRPDARQILNLDDNQVMQLADLLSRSPLINPNLVKPKPKPITFVCACGCGETVTTTYVTFRPKYKHEHRFRVAHRDYWRRRAAKKKAAKEREQLLKGERT